MAARPTFAVRRVSAVGLTLVALLLVAACGDVPLEPAAPSAAAIPRCADLSQLTAPADAYRATPIYVGNEQPIDELRAWALTKPGFEEIWIDRDNNGWVSLGFTQDIEARQRELETDFPDVGVVAVPLVHSAAELEAIQRRLQEVLPPGVVAGSSSMTHYGVVEVMVGVATPERVAAVEAALAGQPVCITGADPADAPPAGPQQPVGDGWRLLASEASGQPYRTGIAFDDASLEALWAESGVSAPVPDIDWQRDVVIWFGAVYGSSCPDLRLDGVVVDAQPAVVHADIANLDALGGCTADANPRAFLVAVERSRLPEGRFAIQLDAEGPPGGAPEERTIVDADLRAPGSVAAPEQVHGDPNLPVPEFVQSGDVIETGFPTAYRMSVHCGVEWLGELNGVMWRTRVPAGGGDFIPPAWRQVVAMDESIVVTVELSEGPEPVVTASANGQTLVYAPAAEPHPGCD